MQGSQLEGKREGSPMNFRDIIRTMAEILVFLILIIGVGAVMGVIMVGVFQLPDLFQHQCLEGAYIQTMKNCIASHDFNSSWCQAGWLK
jgi:hypothetical protein